jgi:acetyl esterase/lipase
MTGAPPNLTKFNQIVKVMPKISPAADISSMRNPLNQYFDSTIDALGPLPAGIKQAQRTIPTRDSFELRLFIFQPEVPPKLGSPLIVLIHGGGHRVDSPEMETKNCRILAMAHKAVVVSTQDRLAPEYPFPFGILDAWEVMKWVAANAEILGATPSAGFIVGGTSAGARIAAALSLLAREEALSPSLTGQYLCVGGFTGVNNAPEKYKHLFLSQEQNANALLFNRTVRDIFLNAYGPHEYSPLYAGCSDPSERTSKSPPCVLASLWRGSIEGRFIGI